MGEEVRGLRSTNRQLQKSRGAAQHSTAQEMEQPKKFHAGAMAVNHGVGIA